MGPLLMLSLLVRLQFVVKIAKLTPFGRLRGTKFALKGALGTPKGAPREPKRAMTNIDSRAGGVIQCAAHDPPRCKERRRTWVPTARLRQQFKRKAEANHAKIGVVRTIRSTTKVCTTGGTATQNARKTSQERPGSAQERHKKPKSAKHAPRAAQWTA